MAIVYEIFCTENMLCAGVKALMLLCTFLEWHNLSTGPKIHFQVFNTIFLLKPGKAVL